MPGLFVVLSVVGVALVGVYQAGGFTARAAGGNDRVIGRG